MVEMEFQSIWNQYEGERERRKEMEAQTAGGGAPENGGEPVEPEAIDAAAIIAPEETALEGASDMSPAHTETSATSEISLHHTHPHSDAEQPIDGSAVVAPEETALEGASDVAPADDGQDEEEAKAEFRRIAERRVRLGLLLAEVGRNNNITVGQDELNQALAQEARRHPGYERQVIDYYRQNQDALNNLRAPLFEEKVVDFIVELAKPEERRVAPQELLAGGEADGETVAPT